MKESSEASLTMPDELVELATLYDIYGALLKPAQREIFEAYVLDNLSLSEIAGEHEMTRQGVYDTINRSRRKLREYDEKLKLREKYSHIIEMVETADIEDTKKEALKESIETLL